MMSTVRANTEGDTKCWLATNPSPTHISGVNGIIHNWDPPLEGGHLKEGYVGVPHVIKCDATIHPSRIIFRKARL